VPDEKLAADEPKAGQRIVSRKFNKATLTFNDLFFIDDTDLSISSESSTLDFRVRSLLKHPEMTDRNKTAPNPISRPEIFVSRINPRHIAVNPDPDFRGLGGKGFLDANRKPQTVVSAGEIDLAASVFWKRDAGLERRLVIEYFDRNHQFRTKRPAGAIRGAVVSYGSGLDGAKDVQWMKDQSPGMQVRSKENASLVDYINWLKGSEPIMLIDAHSCEYHTEYGDAYGGAAALESALGSKLWRWQADGRATVNGVRGYRYKPSLGEQKGYADLHLSRSVYENGLLAAAGPRIYIHKGCLANSPMRADSVPYNDETYGTFQTAEGVLFYLNGVAVVTRAKVFYDPPENFVKGLTSAGGNVGKGWEAYFRHSSTDAELAKDPAGCKRSYTWSILGDWTLRVK